MNGLNGIKGLTGLGGLSSALSSIIDDNEDLIKSIYERASSSLNGFCCLGSTDVAKRNKVDEDYGKTMNFEDVFKLYNQGISKEEVQAWVWYKRSHGVPMLGGWEKYYLKGDVGKNEQLVVATKDTVIKDNHFRDIKNASKGSVLGKYIKTHTYDTTYKYFIFKSIDNTLHYVLSTNCEITKQKSAANAAELKRLVMTGALFYCDEELIPYPIYAYGNMYDRELQLKADKDEIVNNYGIAIYEQHEKVIW